MARRSFSLLLARRYLNPRRSTLSIFSLISLIGVTLGVMVLVVVMAVYAGLEHSVKDRLLGFTPHILLRRQLAPGEKSSIPDWRAVSEPLKSLPGVESTTPFIMDNVVLDIESDQKPVMFRGIDTKDPVQVDGIARMLDHKRYPDSTADMGLDDRIVISSIVAEQYGITVGQKVKLLSTRNIERVIESYKASHKPPVREAFADDWNRAKQLLGTWTEKDGHFILKDSSIEPGYELLVKIADQKIRAPELELVNKLRIALEQGDPDEGIHTFTADQRKAVEDGITAIDNTDVDKMNSESYKSLEAVVLPKEAEVVGVYQSTQMAPMPDIFMPLSLAQTLSGLDDSVQGIAVRLSDPYKANLVADGIAAKMGSDWETLTWMQQYSGFFTLISQQRAMMYVALSVIMLVAAFSMTAVMFTVTIQKRREIGVMKALGATSWQIVRVFLYQGMILGLLGAVLGVAAGRLFVHYRGLVQEAMRAFGFDPFSASLVGFNVLPAYNDPTEQLRFAAAAFLLCSVAALVPAFFAARADAAKSLRNL